MSKAGLISISIVTVLVGVALGFWINSAPNDTGSDGENVTIENGTQIVKIKAKGGYSPRVTTVKANVPTQLIVKTSGTFDCSSALVIPSLKYRKNLPLSGETKIDLPPQKPGTVLQGLCAMGMYNFQLAFN